MKKILPILSTLVVSLTFLLLSSKSTYAAVDCTVDTQCSDYCCGWHVSWCADWGMAKGQCFIDSRDANGNITASHCGHYSCDDPANRICSPSNYAGCGGGNPQPTATNAPPPPTATRTPTPSRTPTPCARPGIPASVAPSGNVACGVYTQTLRWDSATGASTYSIRVDYLGDGAWLGDKDGDGRCDTTGLGNDKCVDGITGNTYSYTAPDASSIRWWVHGVNSCGMGTAREATYTIPMCPSPTPVQSFQCDTASATPSSVFQNEAVTLRASGTTSYLGDRIDKMRFTLTGANTLTREVDAVACAGTLCRRGQYDATLTYTPANVGNVSVSVAVHSVLRGWSDAARPTICRDNFCGATPLPQ